MIDVGIIIPNYNYGRYLGACIKSIAEMSMPPMAVTFVDDFSTDRSLNVWQKEKTLLQDRGIRTRTVRHALNRGTAAALNSGIAVTDTEWAMPLASDDRIKPFAFEEMEAVLERHPSISVVQFGQHAFGHDSKGVRIDPSEKRRQRKYELHADVLKAFRSGKRISSGCSPFKRILWALCPFPESIRYSEDTAFWMKAAQMGARFAPTKRSVVWVRYHGARKSFTSKEHGIRKRQRIQGVRRHMKTGIPKIAFYASEPHFLDHLLPLYDALPDNVGQLLVTPSCRDRLMSRKATILKGRKDISDKLVRYPFVVVASTGNYERMESLGRSVIYVDHGSGQRYDDGKRLGDMLRVPYDGPRTVEDIALVARGKKEYANMKPVDFYATETHFLQHLAPLYLALPENLRGRFVVSPALKSTARELGLSPMVPRNKSAPALLANRRGLVVVSASGDHRNMHRLGRRVVFCEHGAGQAYPKSRLHSSYAGYPHRQGVSLFLVPGPYSAELNRKAYPNIPVVEIGCPKLDRFHDGSVPPPENTRKVAAISFHWDCKVCPETRSAHPHFKESLSDLRLQLASHGVDLYGHAHPRLRRVAYAHYREAGIPIMATFTEVLLSADVYIIDNSSTLFEFASTGRPVVILNSPHYRKGVHHGLRFWEMAALGNQIDRPKDLLKGILDAIEKERHERRAARMELLTGVYGIMDGRGAQVGAKAIMDATSSIFSPRQHTYTGSIKPRRKAINSNGHRKKAMATYIIIQARTTFKNSQRVSFTREGGRWIFGDGRVRRNDYAAIADNAEGRRWLEDVISQRLCTEITGQMARKLNQEIQLHLSPEPRPTSLREMERIPAAQLFPERYEGHPEDKVIPVATAANVTVAESQPVASSDTGMPKSLPSTTSTAEVMQVTKTIVGKSGSWFSFSDGTKCQGKAAAVLTLIDAGYSEEMATTMIDAL